MVLLGVFGISQVLPRERETATELGDPYKEICNQESIHGFDLVLNLRSVFRATISALLQSHPAQEVSKQRNRTQWESHSHIYHIV